MDNHALESFVEFCDDMQIEDVYDIDVANESAQGFYNAVYAIVSAGVLVASCVAVAMPKIHMKEINTAIGAYQAEHPDVKVLHQLKHRTYKIKPFTTSEKGREIKGPIRKWFADRSNRIIQVYVDENGKELFYFVFSDKSILSKITGKVEFEFYICDNSIKQDANYYMALGCKSKGIIADRVLAWAKKYNKDNGNNVSNLDKFASFG